MTWFLVLLFWNPALQTYDVADGWYPLPYATYALCERRQEFVEQYLPSHRTGEAIVDCILAGSLEDAIAEAKE